MASLALSIAGNAIGGPLLGAVGSIVGGMIDNVLFPAPTKAPPKITSSTYGQAIPLAYGPEVRLGCNMIRTTGWRKQTGKTAKLAQLKGAPPAYETDIACCVGAGPWDPSWVVKIWANGNVLFDSTLGHAPTPDSNGVVTWTGHGINNKDFDSMVVYPGNNLQLPDPTMEAHFGMGNVSAYRGRAYFVLNGLIGTPWGNSVPTLEILCRPQARVSLAQVCNDVMSRCGIDPRLASTGSLSALVQGYCIDSQTDGVTALQPLALVYDFDVAEVAGSLRFSPRGQSPLVSIANAQLAGHAYGDDRPSFEWPNEPEIMLPKLAAITFNDPDRDCQANTQSARKATGSMQSQLQTTVNLTLTSEQARAVADRMLWEAHIGRQTLSAATDDRLAFIESARTYSVETPFGQEIIRINRRTRGINGVIEFEATRDSPDIYSSTAPGASAASQANGIGLGGPINPPVFIEPRSGFPGVSGPTIFIALSGGDGTTVNDAWGGCNVYISTDDVTGDYTLAGVQVGPAVMGKITSMLPSYGGSPPDNSHNLFVDTSESGGEPMAMSNGDAQDAQLVYFVGGEFLAAVDVVADGANVYELSKLYRGLYGTDASNHAIGSAFVRMDSAVFKFVLPAVYVGREVFFRFVSVGETLASATTYSYTPTGVLSSTAGALSDVPTSENLAAGAAVNLFSDSGVLTARNAVATDATKPVNGFVRGASTSGDTVDVLPAGATNDSLSGLTPGTTYYLDPATPGALTDTAPSTVGQGVQAVGVATSATELAFQPGTIIPVASGGGGGGSRGLFDLGTMPSLASFTQVQVSGSVSVVENPGKAISIINSSPPNDGGLFVSGIALAAPSTPYRVAAFALINSSPSNYANVVAGWRDSSTGKIDVLTVLTSITANSGAYGRFENDEFNSPTSRVGANDQSKGANSFGAGIWFGMRDDGTNLHFEYSNDGGTWVTILSKAHGSFLATADEIFIGAQWDDNVFGGLQQSVSFLACDVNGLTRVVG